MYDLFIIYIMSILAFAIYGWDKHCAVFAKWRVPEFLLLALAFLAGAFGALCAMILFDHKTNHKSFLICVPVFLFLQLGIDIAYRMLT